MKVYKTIIQGTNKVNFLKKIARDLRGVGISALLRKKNRFYKLRVKFANNNGLNSSELLNDIRFRQLKAKKTFILEAEQEGLNRVFINGSDINIDSINPRIHICNDKNDLKLFNYVRLFQSVPSSQRVGREIKALIYDDGQFKPTLIGAISLASSSYSIACRDEYFKWNGNNSKRRKDIGLRRIMDLALCLALPPYSYILGGKLIAILAFSDTLLEEFKKKYNEPLLAIIASCATGIHCPIFNRIMIKKGGLFRRIGQTAGYSTLIYQSDTTASARILLEKLGKLDGSNRMLKSKSLRILRAALNSCDIYNDEFLKIGVPKGIYAGFLSIDELNCIREGKKPKIRNYITTKNALEYWRSQLLPKRIDKTKDLYKSFKMNKSHLSAEIINQERI